jgi:hypothetical protein
VSVVLRCSTLNCSISKWVVCCKIVQEKDPNAYQFCLQLPDGSAFIGSTVSSQYTHTPCSGLCLAPETQPLCFDEDGKGLSGQCFLLFMMHLWLYGMGKLARKTICKEGTFSSQ